jgi:hypothetical protein
MSRVSPQMLYNVDPSTWHSNLPFSTATLNQSGALSTPFGPPSYRTDFTDTGHLQGQFRGQYTDFGFTISQHAPTIHAKYFPVYP